MLYYRTLVNEKKKTQGNNGKWITNNNYSTHTTAPLSRNISIRDCNTTINLWNTLSVLML